MSGKVIRFLAYAVVMCLLFSTVCYAEDSVVDFSQYTDEEMLTISEEVQQEIVTRGLAKTATLQRGQYTGGKELPVGAYFLHCKTDRNHHGIVWVSAAGDDLEKEYPSKLYEYISSDSEETFFIEIDEGSILELPFPAELQISTGVIFQ